MKYTQRQWDRIVGYGKVPEEYRYIPNRETDGKDSKRSEKDREEDKRVVAETNPIKTQEIP